ncbi:hypothetical protein D9757_007894 [Collybiopsis confluens]|uniref:Major facilitator superfamily (MFS) profile domain-containing protein n=1 Tax=Collybiopsis confluens TaxID=2823264 RepID=A0A8H5M4S5_9AGAR|nr:hypothetical protein D9757_007894 [Collybiopsis confluens]
MASEVPPDSEKDLITMKEHAKSITPVEEDPLPPEGSQERIIAERKLLRKLDTRVLPTIILIYIMNYIDRNAVTTARLKGLEQDLHLTDLDYNVILSVLYVSYCPAQIPSNMVGLCFGLFGITRQPILRPSVYIGACVSVWGLISLLTGVTHSYGGIVATRLFIGIPEAAFYPGVIYLMSRWYTKKELAFRSAILYGGLLISNAFGSLMAAGILANMEGKLGIRAWRWLFFIEGAITIFIGLNTMWLLPDYPDNTRWMTPKERRLAQARLADDAGEADKDGVGDSLSADIHFQAVQRSNDGHARPKSLAFLVNERRSTPRFKLHKFLPHAHLDTGFRYYYLLAARRTSVDIGHHMLQHRTGERFFHQCVWDWGVMIGYIIALATSSIGGRYFSMFLMASGYCGFSLTVVWVSSTFPRPPAKRAAAIALVNGIGNIGNLIGAFTWKAEWGPGYHQSMLISLFSLFLSTSLSLVIRQWIVHDNKKLDEDEKVALSQANRTRVEEAARLEGISFDEAMRRRKGFRYLY